MKTKKNPKFPYHLFYADGRIQIIKEKYRHPLSKKLTDNPNYLKFVKPRKHSVHGKLMVGLTTPGGTQKCIQLSQAIAQTFLRKKKNKTKVWFKNGNPNHVRASNLYYVNQGDLNHIQVALGTRNMIKQAAVMRKNRTTVGRGNKSK